MLPERSVQDSQVRHRRETWFQIYLWLGIGLAILLFCAIVGLLISRGQLTLVVNFVSTVLLLCPAVICLLPIYIALAVAVFEIFSVHDKVARPLIGLQRLSAALRASTESTLDRIAHGFINLIASSAVIDRWLTSKFEPPSASGNHKDGNENE
jgi:hypothetical protein